MLVGRTAELERIDRLVGDLAGGRPGALWIATDPGSGGTALLDAAVSRAARHGIPVARMRAVAAQPSVPFGFVVDLLRTLGTRRPADLPPRRTEDALQDALLVRTADGPLLLVLDDLTDADESSRRAVVSALARLDHRPLAVLAVGSRLVRDVPWPRLDLSPLADEAARGVVRTALGVGAAEAVVDRLVELLGGNPLALVDVAQSLGPDEVAGRAALPDPLPVGARLRATWDPVVDRWADATQAAVRCLSVVGPGSADVLLASLAAEGLGAEDLDEAEAAGVVRIGASGPVLVHPVVGHLLLDRVAAAERRRLHGRVARAAAGTDADPAVVVDHLLASVALPDARTADELDRQADRARELGLLGEAARARAAAAATTPDVDLRTARALAAVREWVEAGLDPGASAPLLELVATARFPAQEAGWVAWLQASAQPDTATALARTRGAIAGARDGAPHLLPGLLWEAAGAAWAMGDPDTAMTVVDEFLDLSPACGAEYLPWTGQALRAAGLLQLGRVAEAVAVRREVLVRADELDPTTVDLLLLLDAVFLDDLLLADGAAADIRLETALERTSRPGRHPQAQLWAVRAWRARARGDWTSALQMCDAGLALPAGMRPPGTTCGLLALSVELAALQGDHGRLRRHGDLLGRLGHGLADRRRLATLERALGMDALVRGDLSGAGAHLGEAADVGFLGRGLRDAVLPSRVDLVEVLARTSDRGSARDRRDAVVPLLLALDQPLATAWAARASALVSDAADADVWFARALDAHATAPDAFERGRTELLLGEHLRRTRRRAEARPHLARAGALFARVGAEPWRERAAQELRVTGGHVETPTDPVALTAQEHHVASAAAQGRSTREIAEQLVLSPRTVETHLSSVYRKLGLHGRGGLAAALADRSAGGGDDPATS